MVVDIHTIIYPDPLPIFHVKGSHREMGNQIGEAARPIIHHSVENIHHLIADASETIHLTWDDAVAQAMPYMAIAKVIVPKYVEELRGMAEGANVTFEDLAVINALEEVVGDAIHITRCTSIGIQPERSVNGHVLLAHNEDWQPPDESDVYLVHAEPEDEPTWLAMTYGGLLPNIGMNTAGIAQCINSVHPQDYQIGIPRVLISRAVLGARSLEEAQGLILTPGRAAGYNYLLGEQLGDLYCLESSGTRHAAIYPVDGVIAHTNHYLDSRMQQIEKPLDERLSTWDRLNRTLTLLKAAPFHNPYTLQTILSDHSGYPDSICNHAAFGIEPLERKTTICSLVMDLTDGIMTICWGNPCTNGYHTYHLIS